MSMNGIDVSSWQTGLDLNNISYDFVIVKATQGNDYVNPDCDAKVQAALAAGKKWGVYHFADHGDPIQEANYFVDNCLGYIGSGILVLDWEGVFVSDVSWAKTWLDHVCARTGVKPLIYMSESVVNSYDWSSVIEADYGLWVARYRDMDFDFNYDMSNAGTEPFVNWGAAGYAMWQWTSTGRLNGYNGNLDCNIFYGDGNAWDAYARAHPAAPDPTPVPEPVPTPDPVPAPEPTPDPLPEPTPEPVPVPEPQPTPVPQKENWFIQFLRWLLSIFGAKE